MWKHIQPTVVFSEFAKEIQKFSDFTFIGFIIETLDLSLAGSENYRDLRELLKRNHDDDYKK